MKNFYLKIIYKILASYARAVISRNKPYVIAITGSVGKTSAKEAIYQVLFDKFGSQVRKNEGNLNAEIGIPLTILGYKKVPNKLVWPFFLLLARSRIGAKNYPKYLVLEMGVEHRGDIEYFASIVRPDVAVVTSTTPAHFANFENLEDYAKEKISLVNHLKDHGIAIVNYDDKNLSKLGGEEIKTISIKNNKADYFAEDINTRKDGTEFRVNCTGHKINIKSQLLGKQLIYSSLFAFAVADHLEIPKIAAGKSLELIKRIQGRMNVIEGRRGVILIDDTYNANPTSVMAALDTLSEIEHKGRKVLVLGNMNELGSLEEKGHLGVGEYAKGKCDFAIFVGRNAKLMQNAFGGTDSLIFENRQELLKNIDSLLLEKDLVLVKASQNGNFFEEVVKHLMKDPKKATKLLVRQGPEWIKRKN